MAIHDFITTTLNLEESKIEEISALKKDNRLIITVLLKRQEDIRCPLCGEKVSLKEYRIRTYNHLPFAGMPSEIRWKRRRYLCKDPDCRHSFSEENPFGLENMHQSYALLNSLALDLKNNHYSFKDIAGRHGVSQSTVQLYADSFLQVPRIPLPENLGIDEIHSRMAKYGGSYLCVLTDNEHRVLCEILPDRSKRTISRYLENIPLREREKVKYVTIDLWLPYKECALKYFPNCHVAGDPFHVIEHLTAGFSRLRIDLMNQCVYGSPQYYLLKKWHRLLETDCKLDNEPRYNSFFRQKMNYRDLYNALLNISPDLSLAYQLKELYRDFNRNTKYPEAREKLEMIIRVFEEADLYCYREFVSLLKNWKEEIINSFERPCENRKQSNALSENVNSRLRELLLIANGFANFERFRARALYCLNDHVFYALTGKLSTRKREGKKRGSYRKESYPLREDINNDINLFNEEAD